MCGQTSAPTTFWSAARSACFNIGKDSTGIVVADGVKYELGYKDCLYITKGTKEVTLLPPTRSIPPSSTWYPLPHIALTRPA